MLESGIIEPSDSPWSSPVVLMKKKDWSLSLYWLLNGVSKSDIYTLITIMRRLYPDLVGQAFGLLPLK